MSRLADSKCGRCACGEWPHQENFKVIRARDTKNVRIEGRLLEIPEDGGLTLTNTRDIRLQGSQRGAE
jgi:hypothetical protein